MDDSGYIDGEQTERELSGVILLWHEVRLYWKLAMEQSTNGATAPDCFAWNALRGVGVPGGDCSTCPLAQFGSAQTGDGQACKLVRQVFFLRPDRLLPVIVSLPAGSLRGAREYFRRLAAKGLPCFGLVTRIGLEKARNNQGREYSRATFSADELLPPWQGALRNMRR